MTASTSAASGDRRFETVLFDFSGTLFRIEPVETWLRAVLRATGTVMTEEHTLRAARELEEAGALPGGPVPRALPGGLADAWENRDRTPELHRGLYTGLSRRVDLPDPALHDALYDRHMTPEAWEPYPDAVEVLARLRDRGVAVGVVSNIGWDLRPVFRAHGLDAYVDTYALSFEHGAQKPEPDLFRVALEALGAEPSRTLMVGDDRRADGGAAALGCAVRFVDPL
ncbi:HAD family hydrolase, partial [Streptomyces sp. UH6]|uniref:HAD family hydrolase n=1 Tax=Streptomyces sp. UH6 TaxID=2748379 RepID=UPI0015D5017E